jgi:hypothetical protein
MAARPLYLYVACREKEVLGKASPVAWHVPARRCGEIAVSLRFRLPPAAFALRMRGRPSDLITSRPLLRGYGQRFVSIPLNRNFWHPYWQYPASSVVDPLRLRQSRRRVPLFMWASSAALFGPIRRRPRCVTPSGRPVRTWTTGIGAANSAFRTTVARLDVFVTAMVRKLFNLALFRHRPALPRRDWEFSRSTTARYQSPPTAGTR